MKNIWSKQSMQENGSPPARRTRTGAATGHNRRRDHPGFAHGSSGISEFLLYLYQVTGDEKFLDLGKRALDFDIAAAVPNAEGALTWQVRCVTGAPGVPYLRYGSAGIGLALVRYYRALASPRYWKCWIKCYPTPIASTESPRTFHWAVWIGEFLLALREVESYRASCSEALRRLISGICSSRSTRRKARPSQAMSLQIQLRFRDLAALVSPSSCTNISVGVALIFPSMTN